MAYNTPPTKNTGDVFTASEFNTYIRDNFAAGVPDIFTTAGDIAVATGANVGVRLAVGTQGQRLVVDTTQAAKIKWADDFFVMSCLFVNGGAVLQANTLVEMEVPYDGQIVQATVLPDQTGSMLVSVQKATYANYPTFTAITGRYYPGLYAATPTQLTGSVTKTSGSATIAGVGTSFSTQLAVGDIIEVPGGTETERVMVTGIGGATSLTAHRTLTTSASGQIAQKYSTANKYRQTDCATTWTTPTVGRGDILKLNIDAIRTITRATVSLMIKRL
jgi:hypothetical protein